MRLLNEFQDAQSRVDERLDESDDPGGNKVDLDMKDSEKIDDLLTRLVNFLTRSMNITMLNLKKRSSGKLSIEKSKSR